MNSDNGADLVTRWQQGDQQAAAELFERYAQRLIALARSRLSTQLAQRFDPEDVVQSAYRSFFAGARDGRYDLQHGGDLWQLLVAITLHKLHHQVRHNTAGKRTIEREVRIDGPFDPPEMPNAAIAHDPSPIEAVALADELEQIMRSLEPVNRQILELRLKGYNLDEIATQTQRSERTVRRVLERLKQQLEQSRLNPPPADAR